MIIPKGPRPWRAWLSAFVWYAHTPLGSDGLRPSTRSKSVSGPWSNRGELRLYLAERFRLRWVLQSLAGPPPTSRLERFQRTLNRLRDSQFRIGFPDDGRSGAARII